MKDLESLYYALGYLKGLTSLKKVLPVHLTPIANLFKENKIFTDSFYFDYGFDTYYQEVDDDYEAYQRNCSQDDLEHADWHYDEFNEAHDPSQNPWIDVFGPGEEAAMAYWNTH